MRFGVFIQPGLSAFARPYLHYCAVIFVGTIWPVAHADVTLYNSLEGFSAATLDRAEVFTTTAADIVKADELTSAPASNADVGAIKANGEGNSLTFRRTNTGLFYSFEFTSLQPGSRSLVFDDDETDGNLPNFDNALSLGDIDNEGAEDDDWRLRLLGASQLRPMTAFGFELRDNNGSDGEFIRLYNSAGELVHEVAVGTQANGNVFLGVVSDEPFTEVRYDEGAGGDDIAVADFQFVAGPNPSPTAIDVFAAVPISTVQAPQSVTIPLVGVDESSAPLTYFLVGGAANGTLRDISDGSAVVTSGELAGAALRYTPDVNFAGTDVFTYQVSDGESFSAIRTGTVEVFASYRQTARQLGAGIDGEAPRDESGRSVALSSDGQTLAIGAPLNNGNGSDSGHVRIYRWTGVRWEQRGADIDGEAALDDSGRSVALSGDGQTVAIGATENDGIGAQAGHVRLFRWSGLSWVQLGRDIDGEAAGDLSGYKVSLSGDGQTVAIAAQRNDGAQDSDVGHVRVYRWSGVSWVQLGADIDGEASRDQSGFSLALSSDGLSVAIGAIQNDGNGSLAGHVRVYRWSGSAWEQRGDDFDGEASRDEVGRSVALSSDGQIVAVGSKNQDDDSRLDTGYVRVYRWSGVSWAQLGASIAGEFNRDLSGFSVALSADGQTIVIGAPRNVGNNINAGHLRRYRWTGASWVQLGADIDGETSGDSFGFATALSSDGQVVAVAAPGRGNSDTGQVRVFDLTLSSQDDDDLDGVPNGQDLCPLTPLAEVDGVDSQGCALSQIDSDNDGVNDAVDAFPNDPSETTDTDGDGLGDNRETQLGTLLDNADTDSDGFSDFEEIVAESDPLSADDFPRLGGLNIPVIKAALDADEPQREPDSRGS